LKEAEEYGVLAAGMRAEGRLRRNLVIEVRSARGEPPDSGTAATAAEPAFQILGGKAMLRGPCLKLRDINRIG